MKGRLYWKALRGTEVSGPCRQMPFLPKLGVQIDKKATIEMRYIPLTAVMTSFQYVNDKCKSHNA